MGALYPDFKCWVRGRSVETGKLVYGNYIQMVIDSKIRPHIYGFPKNANSGNHAYTADPIEVKPETVQRYTGLSDFFCNSIYEGDVVELPTGQRGKVCFELGTWAVSIGGNGILWDEMEKIVERTQSNNPHFLYNDNFASLYELLDNFCPEDAYDSRCSAVCIVSDNSSQMDEFREYYREETEEKG